MSCSLLITIIIFLTMTNCNGLLVPSKEWAEESENNNHSTTQDDTLDESNDQANDPSDLKNQQNNLKQPEPSPCEKSCISGFIGHGMSISFEPKDQTFKAAEFVDAQDFGERFADIFVIPYIQAEGKDPELYNVSIIPEVTRDNFPLGFNLYLQASQNSEEKIDLSEGNFVFNNLKNGTYTLRAVKSYTLKIEKQGSLAGSGTKTFHCLSFEHSKAELNIDDRSKPIHIGAVKTFKFYYHKQQKACGQFDYDNDGIKDYKDTDDDNDGIADAVDCAPLDETKHQLASVFIDADFDTYGAKDSKITKCIGHKIPPGFSVSGGDCSPNDAETFQLMNYRYADIDGDEHYVKEDGTVCSGTTLPKTHKYNLSPKFPDDLFPEDPLDWADLDGDTIGDNQDEDKDGDGVNNDEDAFPINPLEWSDFDKDEIGDNEDPDDDNDGLSDTVETNTGIYVNAQNTGTNPLNPDTDSDGFTDAIENNVGYYINPDLTGTNPNKADSDSDGTIDSLEALEAFAILEQHTSIIIKSDQNRDKIASPGEKIYYTIKTKNLLNTSLNNITATISSSQNNLIFDNKDPFYFGRIYPQAESCGIKSTSRNSGDCDRSAGYYKSLTVADITASPSTIPITITFYQNEKLLATIVKNLAINKPDINLEIKSVTWKKSNYSKSLNISATSPGKLTAGSYAYLHIDIKNKGKATALNLTGTISSPNTAISFPTSYINLGSLAENDTSCLSTNTYSSTCDYLFSYNMPFIIIPSNYSGSTIPITISLKDAFKKTYILSLNIPLNKLPQNFKTTYQVIADSNGDGLINSGEGVYLKLNLKQNTIFGMILEKATLSSPTSSLIVETPEIYFDPMTSIGTTFCGTNILNQRNRCSAPYTSFVKIKLNSGLQKGTIVPLELTLHAKYSNARWITTYNLRID